MEQSNQQTISNKTEEPMNEEQLKAKARALSMKEVTGYGVMDGFGLRYLAPYVIEIGKNNPNLNTYVGLLTSLPSLLGSLSMLLTLKVIGKVSRKKIVCWSIFLQGLMWLPLILVGWFFYYRGLNSGLTLTSLVLIYTMLIIFGGFAGPVWSSWIKDLVSKDVGNYFGKRTKIAGFVALIGLLIAGFILDYFKGSKVFFGFIILFTLAFLGRMISVIYLTKEYEPKFKPQKESYFSFFDFVKKMWFNNYGKFVIYYALVSLTLTIASPFFAVYILKELNLGYIAYMAIIISPAITGFLFMTGLGKFTDSYGNINLIKICGYLTPAIPFLWLISFFIYPISPTATIIYLVIIEAIGGLVWAGFNLSANNFIYEAVTKERIAICVSYFNVINGIGVFIGPLIGGILASKLPTTFGLSALLIVFIISGVSRFAVSFYMIPKIKEVRKVKKYGFKEVKESFTNLSLMDFVEYLEINMLKTRPV